MRNKLADPIHRAIHNIKKNTTERGKMTNEKKRPPITWDLKPKTVKAMIASIEESAEYEAKHGTLHIYESTIVTKEFFLDLCRIVTALQKKRLK